jgi:hypothetical protein
MTTLEHLQRWMNERQYVRLDDGRTGAILRIDTHFPTGATEVSLFTQEPTGPGIAKVLAEKVIGAAERRSA